MKSKVSARFGDNWFMFLLYTSPVTENNLCEGTELEGSLTYFRTNSARKENRGLLVAQQFR